MYPPSYCVALITMGQSSLFWNHVRTTNKNCREYFGGKECLEAGYDGALLDLKKVFNEHQDIVAVKVMRDTHLLGSH